MAKKIEKIADLTFDSINANKGTPRGRTMLEESLRKYGVGRPIVVDKNGVDIGGNKTHEVWASIADNDDVIVVQSDGKKLIVHQRMDLDMQEDAAARELALMDNAVGFQNLSWDAFNLATLGGMGIDLSIPFKKEEITGILAKEEISLQLEDTEPGGFAGAAKEGSNFEAVIRLSEQQASNEEIKAALKSFCDKYGLTYVLRVA